ncbi:hypothetical protein BJV82DRAFT_597473 [Fennellomyces sp. T-0311]|nr:hypothetical protein BJV82DRAFT_597473 [Fennellomyces sp. T-0311]
MYSRYITANYDEDVVLELCKELTWKRSYVKGAKNHNRSWPQVAPLLEVIPHLLGNSTTRDQFKVILQRYGSLINFLKSYAPGRRNERDSWTGFQSWGYELLTAAQYLQDERYSAEIFPEMHRVDPFQELLVIYPPFFAVAFETNPSILAKPALKKQSAISRPSETSFLSSPVSFRSPVQPITPPAAPKAHLNVQAAEYQPYGSLTVEIQELFKRCVPSRNVVSNRQKLVKKIASALTNRFPKVQLRVELFGSSATGLDFAESDLDLCIIVPEHLFRKDLYCLDKRQREYGSYYNMNCIAALLRRIGMVDVIPITKATVPICKFEDRWMNLKGDINTQHDMGVENSRLIKEYVYLEPRVRPFLYAVKTFVKKRDINSSSKDTISSYTYVLMGLFYLMTCDPPVIPNLQNLGFNNCGNPACRYHSEEKKTCYRNDPRTFNVRFHTCVTVLKPDESESQKVKSAFKATTWRCHNTQSLGELLLGFFGYYSNEHDYNRAVSILKGETITKQRKWKNKKTVFAVQDPFITERNIAGTCTQDGFDRIMDEFKRAYRMLKSGSSFDAICSPIPTLSVPTLTQPQRTRAIEIRKPPPNYNKREKERGISIRQSVGTVGLIETVDPGLSSKGRNHTITEDVGSESHPSPISYESNTVKSEQEYLDPESGSNYEDEDEEEEEEYSIDESEDEEEEYSDEEYETSDKVVDDLSTVLEPPFQPLPDTHFHNISSATNGKREVSKEEHVAKQYGTRNVPEPFPNFDASRLPTGATLEPALHYQNYREVENKPKRATLKLLEMPYYVDKLDIVEAMELSGFEVITIRYEVTSGDGEYMPVREWLVRVVGGLNEDLPPRFELQDMIITRTYETRRLVAYRGIAM